LRIPEVSAELHGSFPAPTSHPLNIDLPVEDRVRKAADLYQLVVSGWGVMVLVPAAVHRLQASAVWAVALGAVEVAAIGLALFATLRQLRTRPDEPLARFDWLNALIGTVLLVEWAFAVAAGHKRFSPTLLGALASWALAVAQPHLDARRKRRRRLRIDVESLAFPTSRFSSFRLAWSEVATVQAEGHALHFHMKDGETRTLSLRRYRNREAIVDAVARGAAAVGVACHDRDGGG
jgi:hypothetical protein